jgi:hypothetical protein
LSYSRAWLFMGRKEEKQFYKALLEEKQLQMTGRFLRPIQAKPQYNYPCPQVPSALLVFICYVFGGYRFHASSGFCLAHCRPRPMFGKATKCGLAVLWP